MALSSNYEKLPTLDAGQLNQVDIVRRAVNYDNPAFSGNEAQRKSLRDAVRREVAFVFFGPDGEPLSEERVRGNTEVLQVRYGSRAKQILTNGHDEEDDEQENFHPVSPETFRRSPRTIEKVFQEIFTAEIDRQIFPQSEEGRHIPDIVIDPDRITEALLRDLDLAEHIPLSGTRSLQCLEHYAGLEWIIKERLSHVKPLRSGPQETKKHYRVFRVESGTHEGHVLTARAIHNKDRISLSDLYGTIAGLRHIETGYRAEQKLLAKIKIDFRRIDNALVNDWSKQDREQLKTKLSSALLQNVDALKKVSNPHKKRIRRSAEQGLRMLEKDNPRAARGAMAQFGPTGIQTLVETRKDDMRRIAAALRSDSIVLENISDDDEEVFKDFYDTVEKYREELRILNPRRKLSVEDREEIRRNLEEKRAELFEIRFEPHLSFARGLIGLVDRCIEELKNPASQEDKAEVSRRFLHVYLGAKLERFHARLREFYDMLSQEGAEPFMDPLLKAKWKALKEQIFPRRVAPTIQTDEFHDVWKDIYALLKEIGAELENLRKTSHKKSRQKIIDRIKSAIKGLSLSELLLEISHS